MDWKTLGRSVVAAAPALGIALGGPAGGAIGSLVASAFGAEATPDAVSRAVLADPEAAVKLREWLGSSRGSAEKQRVLESR